ncbi:MAG: EexN family lipoprotein [Xanthomonadales bacterium]|nr:EexN family lipoprotein [Xanthomonadales bacterium]
MKIVVLLFVAVTLAACNRAAPTDTVDSLVAHPDHLHGIERQCANNDARVSAAECELASEARRKLFMGNGTQYTPPKNPPKF